MNSYSTYLLKRSEKIDKIKESYKEECVKMSLEISSEYSNISQLFYLCEAIKIIIISQGTSV